jgi:hypothetical protein
VVGGETAFAAYLEERTSGTESSQLMIIDGGEALMVALCKAAGQWQFRFRIPATSRPFITQRCRS